jgi:hypothetical protein
MANEPTAVEVLEQDILERAGIERRDDVPIAIEATWGGQTFTTGEVHPLMQGHLIFAIFHTPTEVKIYSLCPQTNGAPPKSPKEEMRSNPARTTLMKTARSTVIEIMVLDVFVESIVQDLLALEIDTYGVPPEVEDPPKEEPKEPQAPAPVAASGA